MNQEWDWEEHVAGAAALTNLAIDFEPQMQIREVLPRRICDEITHRAVRVQSFADLPCEIRSNFDVIFLIGEKID